MARYRKLLMVSVLGLTAIVISLFSQQLFDWYPEQSWPVDAVSGLERVDHNQASSPAIPVDDGDHEVPLNVEQQFIAKNAQDITSASESIALSGWVGTDYGETVSGETVVLYSPSQKIQYSVITGTSGEFKLADVQPGWDYVLTVSPQGMFKRYTKSQIKLSSDQEVHNIVLESIPLGLLTGRVVDPYGRPVTSIEIFLQAVETNSRTANVITDANGSFSVAEFPKGRFKLGIKGQQTLRATGLQFDPDTGDPVNLTIDLGPYSLAGRIYDESGQTFDGADVFLNWALHENGVRIRSTRMVSANASGKYQFTGLGPGDHELVVSAWRGDSFKKTIRQSVNVGVDSGELDIVFNTL